MKRRTLLLVLAGAALVVLGLLAALRLPVTQRWLLHRAVAGVPGVALEVEHVSAGLAGAELRGVAVTVSGARLRLPVVRARYDGWALLVRRELVVDELVATDVDAELVAGETASASPSDGFAAVSPVFGGLLAPLQLPLRATIDAIQLGGRLRVSSTRTIAFSAQGRLLLPGQTATTDLHLEWADADEAAAARALDWVGRLTTVAEAAGKVERLTLEGTLAMPKGAGGGSEQGVITRVLAAREPTTGAETIEASARLTTAKPTDQPPARIAVAYRRGSATVDGTWTVNLRREQLDGIVDLERLPEFTADAQGTFSATVVSGDLVAEGQAAFTASRLQRLRREFSGIGPLTGKLDFAAQRRGETLHLGRLELAVNDARGPVVAISALQPLEYRAGGGAPTIARPGEDLARVTFGGLPLGWLQPWLGEVRLGGTVTGGEIRLRGNGTGWTTETTRPLTFAGVRYGQGDRVVAEQLAGTLKFRAGIDGETWTVEGGELALRSSAATGGSALTLQLDARQEAAGRGRVTLPVVVENQGRRSQLRLDGDWTWTPGAKRGEARLSGDTVHVQDLAVLAAFAPSSNAPAAPARPRAGEKGTERTGTKDTAAFWGATEGRVQVDFKRIVVGSEEFADVRAIAVCDPRRLSIEQLSAQAKRAPLEAKVGVTFDAAKSQPYALQGDCAFPGFDLGAWLRAARPDEAPAIESVLDVNAKVEGHGGTLDELLGALRGDFVLRGGPGVLRAKDKRVEAASAIGGLVLGLLSKEKQQQASVAAGSQLLEEMREFRFERLEVSLARGQDLNLQFRTIDVRSAEKRLSGSGVARHVAGGSIADYPLQLELHLAGKENFGALLDKAGLLGGTKDDLGYITMREAFTVTGTVGEPNWKAMLAKLATGLVLGK